MNDIDFFRDEIRDGFYIPTAIKQAWAMALDVLSEIDRICVRHNISYFADWGTLLGAVRHGGFIPWDDDLDIGMKRDDYLRFREVADKELPSNYTIHDYKSKDDHWLFLARVVNNYKMCFEDNYLKEHYNFPWLVGVDIFIKDYLYMDESAEKRRDDEIMRLIAITDGIVNGDMAPETINSQLRDIETRHHISLPEYEKRCDNNRTRQIGIKLYELAEQLMSLVDENDTSLIGQIFPFILKGQKGVPKGFYEKTIRIPFENTTIPVPVGYSDILSRSYGCYFNIVKQWGGHDYPAFEGQKEEMEEIAGEALFKYDFREEMLNRTSVDNSNSLKTISSECLETLSTLLDTYSFNDAQTLAVDLGTLTEQVKGEDNPSCIKVVNALQDFCDALWQEFQQYEAGKLKGELTLSRQALDTVRRVLQEEILDRREVLFLPIGYKEWDALRVIADEEMNDNTDILIVPLPLMRKDLYGNVLMSEEDIETSMHREQYPDTYRYEDYKTYDIMLHLPDEVYIQNAYDDTNPYLTVPREYYSSNLRKYTNRLVYVPIGKVDEFTKDDWNDWYNLKHQLTTPAGVYADEIYVQSDNMKKVYTDKLTEWAGKSTYDFWDNKLKICNEPKEQIVIGTGGYNRLNEEEGKESMSKSRKKLLYCIGANELYESKDKLVDIINGRLDIINESDNSLSMSLAIYPGDRNQWGNIDTNLAEDFFKLVDDMKSNGVELIDVATCDLVEVAKEHDAYYGSPSPLVVEFTRLKKPAMLCDYTVEV